MKQPAVQNLQFVHIGVAVADFHIFQRNIFAVFHCDVRHLAVDHKNRVAAVYGEVGNPLQIERHCIFVRCFTVCELRVPDGICDIQHFLFAFCAVYEIGARIK